MLLGMITPDMVGLENVRFSTYPEVVHIASAIGPVQRQDVGKMVYSVDGVIQVENNQQRNERLKRLGILI